MALGDVIRGDDGQEYVVIWTGARGSFSLLDLNGQRESAVYTRTGRERTPRGTAREPYMRHVEVRER